MSLAVKESYITTSKGNLNTYSTFKIALEKKTSYAERRFSWREHFLNG